VLDECERHDTTQDPRRGYAACRIRASVVPSRTDSGGDPSAGAVSAEGEVERSTGAEPPTHADPAPDRNEYPMKRTLLLPLAAATAIVVAACGGASSTAAPATAAPTVEATSAAPASEAPMSAAPSESAAAATGDIVDVATEAGSFKTLLTAATAAGLVDTLKGEGPFTVFAPSDEAFAKLPAGTVEDLLKDPEALKAILLYHVVAGKVTSDQVVGLTSADTVGGPAIKISTKDGSVYLNDTVKVVTTDIEAANGVIHVIDGVLLPPTS
jgi:uncharacterized surface protein with fasciclin (FAS1) repeats